MILVEKEGGGNDAGNVAIVPEKRCVVQNTFDNGIRQKDV